MSGREWKPGDVAMARFAGTWIAVFRTMTGWVDEDGDTYTFSLDRRADVRPLVVLDPEDREQVERLADIFCEYPSPGWVDEMQAALREFVAPTPPKPEEPQGLGAVVEDAEGERWVRWGLTSHGEDWTRQIGNASTTRTFDRIDVVRVLSEGVEQ